VPDLEEHLFRHEAGRMLAALTRLFGVHHLELAEDLVQDAFCRALEVWKVRGIPENPAAWLMATAKHRALDVVRRERTTRTFAPELTRTLEAEASVSSLLDEGFADRTVRVAELRMMFSCCHPLLAEEAQLALILNISCGFGTGEIASALLTSRAAVEKRISRGKKLLASSRTLFELGDPEFERRLGTVQRALYLLFSEGYHGASEESAVRVELCDEAMRLTAALRDYAPARTPTTTALSALMCLQVARLGERLDSGGDLNALVDQDRSAWDARLLAEGLELFEQSAAGEELSVYHVESAIAATHAGARSLEETDFNAIVALYDRLMNMAPSPIIALNRAIALGFRDGPERGLEALRSIDGRDRLSRYPFYPAALGELELRSGRPAAARQHFRDALSLARNGAEVRFLEKRLRACDDA
jgi:RNA polymerase sigma-70 factor (ECF subfamily)